MTDITPPGSVPGGHITHDTPFNQKGLNELKDMLSGVNVQTVREIAQNWQDVHDLLVGRDGSGGIKKDFEDAVNKVLESWHGSSADGFRRAALKISTNFNNGAPYAERVSQVMFNTADVLQEAYGAVTSIEEPGLMDRGLDAAGNFLASDAGMLSVVSPAASALGSMLGMSDGRSDAQLNSDLANPNLTTQQALERNRGELSEGRERALQAAVHMEALAVAYKTNARAMGQPGQGGVEDHIPEQQPPSVQPIGSLPMVPTNVSQKPVTGATRTGPSTSGYTPITPTTSPQTSGISGGIGNTNPPKSSIPSSSQIRTGLDGFSGGAGGGVSTGGVGGGIGGGSVGAGSGGIGSGSGVSGMPGMPGGPAGRAGGAASRAGAGAGRSGMPGMGSAGAGVGAGAKGAAGSRGGLARQKGGVVGEAKGKSGVGPQGGSGLHRSRGGTQAGKLGVRGAGMMGAPGALGGRAEDERREGQRPDYLVEDEETWQTQRNVTPRVIE